MCQGAGTPGLPAINKSTHYGEVIEKLLKKINTLLKAGYRKWTDVCGWAG